VGVCLPGANNVMSRTPLKKDARALSRSLALSLPLSLSLSMQMGRGKGKRKTAVQGPEYQGLISVVAPVTPIRRSADGERQSLYFAHAMCTDRNLVAGVARARLPYRLQTWFPEWTQLGVHVARGLEPRRRRRG